MAAPKHPMNSQKPRSPDDVSDKRTSNSGHSGERGRRARRLEVVHRQARGDERVLDRAGRGGDDVGAVGERGLVEAEQRHLEHRHLELLQHVRAVRCGWKEGASETRTGDEAY